MSFTLNPLGICAAEITGFDCAVPCGDQQFAAIHRAFLDYPVLVFRDQTPTAPEFAAFARHFGTLESYGGAAPAAGTKPQTAALRQTDARKTPDQMLYLHPEDSDVLIMTNEMRADSAPLSIIDNAETWHADGSHKPEPYKAVLVHVIQNPADGGETEFCDLRAMYDALPPDVKTALNGKYGIHHWSKSRNPLFAATLDGAGRREGERIAALIPDRLQPLVYAHPETGRPNLFLSPRFTIGVDQVADALAKAFMAALFAMMDDPQFIYRHTWRDRDLMIWDNRCTNHRVQAYAAGDIRTRHRITVSGEPTRPYTPA